MTDFDNLTVIGLTGMSGAGKTTVCSFFDEYGVKIINCDNISRDVVKKGSPCLAELCKHFGPSIVTETGELDRRGLAGIVFSDNNKLRLLNALIYPYICYRIITDVLSFSKKNIRYILLDAPTLFESGADDFCDVIVSVVADLEISKARIIARDGITAKEAENRLKSQNTSEFYRRHSDFCIENNGDEAVLKTAVLQILKNIEVINENR